MKNKLIVFVFIICIIEKSIFASGAAGCEPEIFMVNSLDMNNFEKNNNENSIEIMNSTDNIDIIQIKQDKQKDFDLYPFIDNDYSIK